MPALRFGRPMQQSVLQQLLASFNLFALSCFNRSDTSKPSSVSLNGQHK